MDLPEGAVCWRCGYKLKGHVSEVCSECGSAVWHHPDQPEKVKCLNCHASLRLLAKNHCPGCGHVFDKYDASAFLEVGRRDARTGRILSYLGAMGLSAPLFLWCPLLLVIKLFQGSPMAFVFSVPLVASILFPFAGILFLIGGMLSFPDVRKHSIWCLAVGIVSLVIGAAILMSDFIGIV